MTKEQLQTLQYALEGTCQTLAHALASLDLDEEDEAEVENRLLDEPHPVEECKECAWWFSVSDLIREKEEDCGYCDQCRPDSDEDEPDAT